MFDCVWSSKLKASKLENYQGNTGYNLQAKVPLFWSEHCVECAMPLCYSQCNKYLKRLDGRCVRFDFGINPIEFNEYYCHQISFRPWAKLQTELPRKIKSYSINDSLKYDKLLFKIARKVNRFSSLISNYTFNHAFSKSTQLIVQHNVNFAGVISDPDFFLLDFHSDSTCKLNLELVQDDKVTFRQTFNVKVGWNLEYIEYNDFNYIPATKNQLRVWFSDVDEDKSIVITFKELGFYNGDIIYKNLKPAAKIKCVAWDLDNTLWSGVIGDDGFDNVSVNQNVIDFIKELDSKGILQTIVSKNTYDIAWPKIVDLGLHEYFLYPAINWGRKSQNLLSIAKTLNFNIDTFAFIDDSIFEREEVTNALPQVRVYDPVDLLNFKNGLEFDVPISHESANRRFSYINEIKRNVIRESWDGNYDDFIKDCNVNVSLFYPNEKDDKLRVQELLLRSNQYNLSTNRYTDAEFEDLLCNSNFDCYAFKVNDKFGEYGIVGFISIKLIDKKIFLTDFVMSCRVAQKFIESNVLNYLIKNKYNSFDEFYVNGVCTDRNKPLRDTLLKLPHNVLQVDKSVFSIKINHYELLNSYIMTINLKS